MTANPNLIVDEALQPNAVIASEAKQSSQDVTKIIWIASSLALLATTINAILIADEAHS